MHSLTARSISREFREGLKQISSKPTATIHSVILEQSKMPTGTTEKNNELENTVIPPGKLKNNIQFWEKLQKKN